MKNIIKLFSAFLILAVVFAPIGWALEGDSNITRIIPESYETPVETYTSANTANTLTAAETGKSLVDCGASTCGPTLTASCSKHTLPTAVAGYEFSFSAGRKCSMTVDVQSTDTILYSISGTGLDAGDSIKSTGQAGDSVTLYSPVANVWAIKAMKGTWTDNGTN